MNNNKPIGIFDSGVGGLSILKHIRQLLPKENILYVADSGFGPYGCKGDHFIEQRSRIITEFLLEQGSKVIVIACNTATASIIERFRKDYGIPFVGVEPGIKPAIEQSKNGNIGVMATQATIASERYKDLSERFTHSHQVHSQPCPGLADQVEAGEVSTQKTLGLLQKYIDPLLKKQVDTLVLGCTHYSFLSQDIRNLIGETIKIVDTSRAIAEQVERVLNKDALLNSSNMGRVDYYTSGSVQAAQEVMERMLEHKVNVMHLEN